MFTSSFRVVALGSVVVAGLVVAVSGQGRQTVGPAPDDLLVEVRALRAEINQAARAAMRAQLLGMRLQLQEQRVADVARRLGDVQERLRGSDRAKAQLAVPIKMFDQMLAQAAPDGQSEVEHVFGPLKDQLGDLEKSDLQLKADEAALLRQLAEEQSRWTSFNADVEKLEQASAGKVVR